MLGRLAAFEDGERDHPVTGIADIDEVIGDETGQSLDFGQQALPQQALQIFRIFDSFVFTQGGVQQRLLKTLV